MGWIEIDAKFLTLRMTFKLITYGYEYAKELSKK